MFAGAIEKPALLSLALLALVGPHSSIPPLA
jgi:hypothetical protein